MMAIRAWFTGCWRICRSPWITVVAYLLTLLLTVPLGLVLYRDLPSPSVPVAVEPGAGPAPNLDWLEEVTNGLDGLAATLAPTVIGVAAPLSNFDRFLAGSRPPLFVVVLTLTSMLVWAFLWGGIVSRIADSPSRFLAACRRTFVPIVLLSLISISLATILFMTLRPLLFDLALPALTRAAGERTMFVWRSAFTLLFVAVLAASTLIADYARISLVLDRSISVGRAVVRATDTVRANWIAVSVLLILSSGSLVALLTAYGAFEFIPGGSVPRLTRVIVIGQAFIFGRILLRLVNAGAQTVLYQDVRRRAANR